MSISLDAGWTETRSTDAPCPTRACVLEEAEAKELIGEAELLHPADQKPRVYYNNVPKKFITGTLYDPAQKEVVIGASLTLMSNGSTWTTTTDGFGGLLVRGTGDGGYDLEITASGFAPKPSPLSAPNRMSTWGMWRSDNADRVGCECLIDVLINSEGSAVDECRGE